jgi:uncharacterized damage-inducible protein DinB
MTFLELYRLEFDEEMKKTGRMLESLPDGDFSWKPHEKSMALGRLAVHVSDIPDRVTSILYTDALVRPPGFVPFTATSRSEALDKFVTCSAEAKAALQSITDDQLAGEWAVKLGDKTLLQLPRSMALRMVVLNHLIHHRAQLGVYLRLLDAPIPGMFGPSADDGPRI